jgi:uncharacterized protein YsxB (DUF464 family)
LVEVVFTRDSRRRLSSVFATGHAEFGAFPNDVVCAAVSAILQAAYAGLEDVAGIPLDGRRDAGELSMRIPAEARERVDVAAIVRTAEISLEQLARQYPDHVRVTQTTGEG